MARNFNELERPCLNATSRRLNIWAIDPSSSVIFLRWDYTRMSILFVPCLGFPPAGRSFRQPYVDAKALGDIGIVHAQLAKM